MSRLDPEIRITYYGSDAIPYAGDYRGTAGALDFFATVADHIQILAMEPWLFIPDGDNLAVWGHQTFRRIATGHTWESEFAHIITPAQRQVAALPGLHELGADSRCVHPDAVNWRFHYV